MAEPASENSGGSPSAAAPARRAPYDFAVDALAALAGALLMAIALLVTVDVAGRLPERLADTWLFTTAMPALFGEAEAHSYGFSLPWTTEVTEYALYLMTFFGAPWVLREGGHITIDIVTQLLGPVTRARVIRVTAVLGALITGVLFYYSVAVLRQAIAESTDIVRTLIVPEWWILAPLPICVLLLFLIFLRWMIWPGSRHEEGPPEGL
jgi:TRAP-type C4-dicarboxylate transport system permease small subunit